MPCYTNLLFGHEKIVDNFAGGGGASEGIEQGLGRPVDLAINHDPIALAIHAVNHPSSEHAVADVWDINPEEAVADMPVGLAWFSPDCRHHSKAKGGRPVSKSVRGLAWVAARWAARVKPRCIVIENVEELLEWGPLVKGADGKIRPCPERKGQTFQAFVRTLKRHKYRVEWNILRACDYGAPTIRKRLFIVARRDDQPIVWPAPSHGAPDTLAVKRGKLKPWRTTAECIDWTIPCPSIFGRKKPLVENSLKRIAKGMVRYVLEHPQPFLVKLNHTASYYNAFRGQSLFKPLQTITTSPGFAVVSPTLMPVKGRIEEGGTTRVAAFLAKHYTGVVGADLRTPLPTGATVDHNALVSVRLENISKGDIPEAYREKALLTAAFLAPFYGSGSGLTGRDLRQPCPTITTVDRFQLITVTIDGDTFAVVDVGMRMLQPHELAQAQGFPESYVFGTVNGKPLSKRHQVRLIGNSVCPPLARAIVEANFQHEKHFMPAASAA
ncbi:DNA cytosine methyltransferase [Vreelandella alkaliphila]|uniref:DNA cytosine methyltransferase n=1 Tax=Halomonadaceae TaxID=28256 RepID=UPI003F92734C